MKKTTFSAAAILLLVPPATAARQRECPARHLAGLCRSTWL